MPTSAGLALLRLLLPPRSLKTLQQVLLCIRWKRRYTRPAQPSLEADMAATLGNAESSC